MELIEQISPGDHCALFFQTRVEQFHWVCPFIASGLRRAERCLYIAYENSVPLVMSKLTEAGIPVVEAQARGALHILTKQQSYQKHGMFEPARMVDDLAAEVDRALADGFAGFRATGEMTWAGETPEALLQLREYEAKLHRSFRSRLTGLCQYDETRFSPSLLSDMIRIHPKIIAKGRIITNRQQFAPEEMLSGSLPQVSLRDL
jgi:chemotaxis family two-component system sensor kinase Cph1